MSLNGRLRHVIPLNQQLTFHLYDTILFMLILENILSSPYITLALLFFVIILIVAVFYLSHKLSIFMRGENGKSFESIIKKYLDAVDELKKHDELISEHALDLETRLSQCVRNISVSRFKAFESGSSNQSFSISLVNEKGDGVVVTSLHNRDRVSTFAKPISKYKSTHELTDEEKQVLHDSKIANKKVVARR